MPGNSFNIDTEQINGKAHLPLQAFFENLKRNGFLVTPEQIIDANRIITFQASHVKNANELCNYLSPVFARNEDEQLQFRDIFHLCFCLNEKSVTGKGKNSHLKRHAWKYVSVLIVLTCIALFISHNIFKPVHTVRPEILIFDQKDDGTLKDGQSPFLLAKNERLNVFTRSQFTDSATKKNVQLSTTYNWGDKTISDTIPGHVYSSAGTFNLVAYVSVSYDNIYQFVDTITQNVTVCAADNRITITPGEIDSIRIGQRIKLHANIKGNKPDSIKWNTEEYTLGYGNDLDASFTEEGRQSIYCTAIYDSVASPCTIRTHIDLNIYDPASPVIKATISKSLSAKEIPLSNKVKNAWFIFFAVLTLLSFVLTGIVALRNKKRKEKLKQTVTENDQQFTEMLNSFSNKKIPAELPWRNNNYLAVPEAEINEAASRMQRRVNNDSSSLQVKKTIERSINNLGFFEPVYRARLQQSEYLVLVDASHNNNQQVRLFDYLIEILKKQNVFIEKYYYRYEPRLCFNNLEPGGISLEKLSGKYEKHILLIFGNAYQLLSDFYPVFNNEYSELLNRWESKAIITPVSFLDWDSKEFHSLLPNIPVIPVDAEGQLSLMEILFNSEYDVIDTLKQHQKSFYETTTVDFEDPDELKAYCDKAAWARVIEENKTSNILFQWIAALAIYPKIRWELTLAIGKAILDKYGKGNELNFTTLLRIARIKWMKDGQFSESLRLDLLKSLEKSNEVLARKTILALLKDIPKNELSSLHFAYEEKEIQRITNEFILYAHNPKKYADYEKSKNLFEKLWRDKKITDGSSRIYLKNEKKEWSTLINPHGAGRESDNKKVSIEEYFEPQPGITKPRNTFYGFLLNFLPAIFILSLISLILLFVLDASNSEKFSLFTYRPAITRDVRFNVINNTKTNPNKINFLIDRMAAGIKLAENLPLNIGDSMKSVIVMANRKVALDTAMDIRYDSYDVSVNGDSNIISNSKDKTLVKLLFSRSCISKKASFENIIQQVDSSLIVKDSLLLNTGYQEGCTFQIMSGNNVNPALAQKIMEAFKKNNTRLEEITANPYAVKSNEIIIASTVFAYQSKPVLYIQYNNRKGMTAARKLQSCLQQGIFDAPEIELSDTTSVRSNRIEIRYFNNNFRDSLAVLSPCLSAVYPGKKVTSVRINQRRGLASAEIWIYDSIYKFQPVPQVINNPGTDNNQVNQEYAPVNFLSSGCRISGEKHPSDKTSRIGLFVQNKANSAYGIYAGSLTQNATRGDSVFSNNSFIGTVDNLTKTSSLIGLVRLNRHASENQLTTDRYIKGVKGAYVGQEIFLYDPDNIQKPVVVKASVTKVNVSADVLLNTKQTIKVNNVFTADISTIAGRSGCIVVDKDDYAIGILIGDDKNDTYFIPLQQILNETGMAPVIRK